MSALLVDDDLDERPPRRQVRLSREPPAEHLWRHLNGIAAQDAAEEVVESQRRDQLDAVIVMESGRNRGRRLGPGGYGVFGRPVGLDRVAEVLLVPEVDARLVAGLEAQIRAAPTELRLDRQLALNAEVGRVEEGAIQISRRWSRPTVQMVEHEIADRAPADRPVGGGDGAPGLERCHQPRTSADQADEAITILTGDLPELG